MTPRSNVKNTVSPLKGDLWLTSVGIGVTMVAFVMFAYETLPLSSAKWSANTLWASWESLVFLGIVGFLVYGNLVYQFTRFGYLRRKGRHHAASRQELEAVLEHSGPSVTVLVPSYKEEPSVVYQTLMSAALQEYANLRVVLLIDDPPSFLESADHERLIMTRGGAEHIQQLLNGQKAIVAKRYAEFSQKSQSGEFSFKEEIGIAVRVSQTIREWYLRQAQEATSDMHTDVWFAHKIFSDQANNLAKRERQLIAHMHDSNSSRVNTLLHQNYRFLLALFSCELSVFERKQFQNLSQEPNKAMNLNTYIGLMGKTVREEREQETYCLRECSTGGGQDIPDADYILTLDADSLLVPDYTLRLIHFLEQPAHARIAVAQTPYSAVPKAPNLIERVAGATTDIQYIIHQGFTSFGGTYWVGANALLRKSALEDIAQTEEEHGQRVTKFIQDRTVIEDTESSIDLIAKGWQLYNYPERLAYSATPPDFGSLLIQRRRWANGGLLILPKLFQFLFRTQWTFGNLWQGFVRSHYLTSIAGVNVGVLLLLLYPFDTQLQSVWLPLTAVPYYFLYGRDLTLHQYQWKDLPRVYALNLLLIPVHIGGVCQSLRQGITRVKAPFCRTPKIPGRTVIPVLYLSAIYGLLLVMLVCALDDLLHQYWLHMIFALVNGAFLFYAVSTYIGFRASVEDFRIAISHQANPFIRLVQANVVCPKLLKSALKEPSHHLEKLP